VAAHKRNAFSMVVREGTGTQLVAARYHCIFAAQH
jgi:hypothetical protein